ncbi:MAG: hypothetical protein ABIJ16_13020 [Bacteroidota bacterium]
MTITSINETSYGGNVSQTITTTSGTGTISRNLNIEKDGTFKSVEVKNVNFVSVVQGETNSTEWTQTENMTTEGLWYWAGKNKENDTRCKEVIIIQATSENNIFSQTGDYSHSETNLSVYEGNDCPTEYSILDKLTSKEFVLTIESSDTDDNSSSISASSVKYIAK